MIQQSESEVKVGLNVVSLPKVEITDNQGSDSPFEGCFGSVPDTLLKITSKDSTVTASLENNSFQTRIKVTLKLNCKCWAVYKLMLVCGTCRHQ